MKRLTYVSRFSRSYSSEELEGFGRDFSQKNAKRGISGVLLTSGDLFFQVIEGEDETIEALFRKIRKDSRHRNVMILKKEEEIKTREYPQWSMKVIRLDEETDVLIQPLRGLFQVLADSHRILERYTQPSVLNLIQEGLNPLHAPTRSEERAVLFSDMMCSSAFAVTLPPDILTHTVNACLTAATHAVVENGGEVNKLIGDCVMAFFRRERLDQAVEAGLDILRRLARLRENAPSGSALSVLYAGVGIDVGIVQEGNFGSDIKTDYTLLGSVVNRANALEALTRKVPSFLAISEAVRNGAGSGWKYLELGRYDLGEAQGPVPIFSIDDPVTKKPGEFDLRERILDGLRSLSFGR